MPTAVSLLLAVAACQTPTPTPTTGSQGFDGGWAVTIACPMHTDGALGYTLRFPAQVTNGVLHGQSGLPGKPGFLSLDGPIDADGSANLLATGFAGDSVYNAGHVGEMSSVVYHLRSRFEGRQGSGSRVETRACTASYARQ